MPNRHFAVRPGLFVFVCILSALSALAPRAEVRLPKILGHHMVLQQHRPIPVWGWADPGEAITVTLGSNSAATGTDADGHWRVDLPPMSGGLTVLELNVTGEENAITLQDILIGEVWICSGQSNMERQLGPRQGQQELVNWRAEAARADYPALRMFTADHIISYTPLDDIAGSWQVCSPETAPGFSAVGYYFGRDLMFDLRVPVGMIHTSWGGTIIEAWTSAESLEAHPDFTEPVAQIRDLASNTQQSRERGEQAVAEWNQKNDPGRTATSNWAAPDYDDSGWTQLRELQKWNSLGQNQFDGLGWYRKTFTVPADWAGRPATISLGMVDDVDTTWLNDVPLGTTEGSRTVRDYDVMPGVLRAGRNVLAVRVLDTGGDGGISGDPETFSIKLKSAPETAPVSIARDWRYRLATPLDKLDPLPIRRSSSPNQPTVLYNAMLRPLLNLQIKGAIWYQGEANNKRQRQYRELLPLMISDWRAHFDCGPFPFLYVQIAPHNQMTPELREAQLLSLDMTQNTAMTVITDHGDARDIHPREKEPVGQRLALGALALAYGQPIEYMGPLWDSARFDHNEARVKFTHVDGGLLARGGELRGFEISANGRDFQPAVAKFTGDPDTIRVFNLTVKNPIAVRYGWANVPDINLFNQAGLPASPFRTNPD